MPFVASTTQPEIVRHIDTYEVTSFIVDNVQQIIHIQYAAGYMQDGAFVPVQHSRAQIDGQAFLDMAAMPAPQGSMYQAIKGAVYAALIKYLGDPQGQIV